MTVDPLLQWSRRWAGGHVEELDPQECRRLLAGTHVGRLVYVGPSGPRAVPMNYQLVADSLVFLTSDASEAGRCARGQQVCFEVDDIDEFLQAGWSVLVPGEALELSAAQLQALDVGQVPEPWAGGVRTLLLQLPLAGATGRRVTGG